AFSRDRRAVDHARFIGGKEQRYVGDILRLADAERVAIGDIVHAAKANLVAAGKTALHPLGQHYAGADRVHAHTLRRIGASQRLGEGDEAALRHDVNMSDVIATQCNDGGEIDDAALALLDHHGNDVAATQKRALQIKGDG